MTAGSERLRVVVRGVVQGVGFRFFVRREASGVGASGWVANRPDGSVEVVAEAGRANLEALLERLAVGPPGSVVRDVEAEWLTSTGEFPGFGVRAGGPPGD